LIDRKNISYNKACSTTAAADHNSPIKKVHCVANKLFVVIDEKIANHLQLNENDTWFEQILTDNGILLKIHKIGGQQHTGRCYSVR
jgi:hypothetical protein